MKDDNQSKLDSGRPAFIDEIGTAKA